MTLKYAEWPQVADAVIKAERVLIMASATPVADVPGQSTALTREGKIGDSGPSFWVAERSRRGARSHRF